MGDADKMNVYLGHFFFKLEHYCLLSTESSMTWRMGRFYIEFASKSISSCMTLIIIQKGIKAVTAIQTKCTLEH